MTWMAVSVLGALGLGILGRAFIERNGIVIDDPETIFIVLSDLLFHPLVTGFLYAALLAAIMSTISSQLLVSSSSLTEDFYRLFMNKKASEAHLVTVGRLSVVLVGVIAAFMADDPNSKILELVSNAWAGFGAAFGPMIILSLTWKKMSGAGAVAGMLTGAVTVITWISIGWGDSFLGGPGVYEIIPGFILAWLAIVLVSRSTQTTGEFRPLPGE
jgi:SSS family solute:Na+ symporter